MMEEPVYRKTFFCPRASRSLHMRIRVALSLDDLQGGKRISIDKHHIRKCEQFNGTYSERDEGSSVTRQVFYILSS